MGKYRQPKQPSADPSGVWGSDDSDQPQSRQRPAKEWGSRKERRASAQETKPRTPPASRTQPEEVSDRVWNVAQHWFQEGEKVFDRGLPINLAEFSRRLQNRIHESAEIRAALTDQPGRHPEEIGPEWVEELLTRMVQMFWESLEAGEPRSAGLQFKFLADDWDTLEDRAKTSLTVRRIKRNPKPIEGKYVSMSDNPYLLAQARATETNFLQAALNEAEDDAPPIRKGLAKRPSKRSV